jgi:quinohemoprotein ethanol dehydrogenase
VWVVIKFALNSKKELPAVRPFTPPALNPPPAVATAKVVEMGRELYAKFCAACHGQSGQTRGATFPDLTRSGLLYAQEAFDQVVLNGVLKDRGMASFSSVLKPEDTQAIRAYMIARANELKAAQSAPALPKVEQQH